MTREKLLKVAKPILFNTDMVKSILDWRKTATRRLIKAQQLIGIVPDKCKNGTPEEFLKEKKYMFKPYCDMTDTELINTAYEPPYQPGDILYVRETWHKYTKRVGKGEGCYNAEFYGYRASIENSEDANEPWKPSIFMPKEAARIFLKVTDVRVERLQEMSQVDFMNEGVNTCVKCNCKDLCLGLSNARICYLKSDFIHFWNSTIKKSDLPRYGWNANPWVWVIEFEKVEV